MLSFEYWYQGVILIVIFLILMAIPCVGTALIGRRMIRELGQHPSKTPFIQMSIFLKLVILELLSFGGFMVFFKIFSTA